MYKLLSLIFAVSLLFSTVAMPFRTYSGSLYEDAKGFVTQNQHYIHGLTVAVTLYSFAFIKAMIKHKQINLDPSATLVVAFIGSYCLSKIAKDYPGFTTIGCVAAALLHHFDVINPRIS